MVEYSLKSQDPSVRHIGVVAQDFATFGCGESDTAINAQDADGVMMAAIQALYAENQSLKAENATQQAQIDALEARIAALEGRKRPIGLALGGGVLLLGLGVIWASQHRQ